MEFLKIVFLCIGAACAYGIAHDQITARVCVEYFTIGHPPIFNTNSPTLLGIGWGIFATWWVDAMLGVLIALFARIGKARKIPAREIIKPLCVLILVMAVLALVAGITGYILGKNGTVYLLDPLNHQVPQEIHAAFLADLWAHLASYGAGFLGGIVICIQTVRNRKAAAH